MTKSKTREQELKEEIKLLEHLAKEVDYLGDLCEVAHFMCLKAELKGIQEGKSQAIKEELMFLEKNYINFTWEGLRKSIKPLLERIRKLKELLEKLKK